MTNDRRRLPASADAWMVAAPAVFVLLWSTGFVGARLGLPYAEPLTFLLLRFACVCVVLLLAAIVLRSPWPSSWREIRRIAYVGLMIHGLYLGGVFSAIKLGVPAAIAALIVGLQPVLTALAAGPYLGERLRGRGWLGLGLGLLGVVLVLAEKLSFEGADLYGIAFALVALLGMTAGTLYQKRHGGGMNLITGSFVQFAAVGLAYLPVALVFESMRIDWTGDFVFALVWLTLVLSIGAISLFHLMIRRGAAAKVASLFYLTPAVTAVLAYMIFGDTLPSLAIAGMLVGAIGVYLVTRS